MWFAYCLEWVKEDTVNQEKLVQFVYTLPMTELI